MYKRKCTDCLPEFQIIFLKYEKWCLCNEQTFKLWNSTERAYIGPKGMHDTLLSTHMQLIFLLVFWFIYHHEYMIRIATRKLQAHFMCFTIMI